MRKHGPLHCRRCANYLHAGIVLLLLGAIPAWSQATSTRTVSGQVIDRQNAVIAGAELQVTNATMGTTLSGAPLIYLPNQSLPNLSREASSLAIFQTGVMERGIIE